jgi:hypothetical protein
MKRGGWRWGRAPSALRAGWRVRGHAAAGVRAAALGADLRNDDLRNCMLPNIVS